MEKGNYTFHRTDCHCDKCGADFKAGIKDGPYRCGCGNLVKTGITKLVTMENNKEKKAVKISDRTGSQ